MYTQHLVSTIELIYWSLAVTEGHVPPHWQVWGSLTDSQCEEIYLWMTQPPPFHVLFSHANWELPGQLSPMLTIHEPGSPSLLPVCPTGPPTDGVGETVRQGQKYVLTLITLALHPAITFSSPSSAFHHPTIHLSAALRAAQYILPTSRHVLLRPLSCCTWAVLQKV